MNIKKLVMNIMLVALIAALVAVPAFAQNQDGAGNTGDEAVTIAAETEENEDSSIGSKAMAAALAVGIAAAGGAISMGIAIAKSSEGISRQPEASDSIRTSMMLGLVFIETAIIYALIVAILIIFVL